jgi:hypothetical protein
LTGFRWWILFLPKLGKLVVQPFYDCAHLLNYSSEADDHALSAAVKLFQLFFNRHLWPSFWHASLPFWGDLGVVCGYQSRPLANDALNDAFGMRYRSYAETETIRIAEIEFAGVSPSEKCQNIWAGAHGVRTRPARRGSGRAARIASSHVAPGLALITNRLTSGNLQAA